MNKFKSNKKHKSVWVCPYVFDFYKFSYVKLNSRGYSLSFQSLDSNKNMHFLMTYKLDIRIFYILVRSKSEPQEKFPGLCLAHRQ